MKSWVFFCPFQFVTYLKHFEFFKFGPVVSIFLGNFTLAYLLFLTLCNLHISWEILEVVFWEPTKAKDRILFY